MSLILFFSFALPLSIWLPGYPTEAALWKCNCSFPHPESSSEFSYAPSNKEENNQINMVNMPPHYKVLPGSRFFWGKLKKICSILGNLQEQTISHSSYSLSLLLFLLLCVFCPVSICFECLQELQKQCHSFVN